MSKAIKMRSTAQPFYHEEMVSWIPFLVIVLSLVPFLVSTVLTQSIEGLRLHADSVLFISVSFLAPSCFAFISLSLSLALIAVYTTMLASKLIVVILIEPIVYLYVFIKWMWNNCEPTNKIVCTRLYLNVQFTLKWKVITPILRRSSPLIFPIFIVFIRNADDPWYCFRLGDTIYKFTHKKEKHEHKRMNRSQTRAQPSIFLFQLW